VSDRLKIYLLLSMILVVSLSVGCRRKPPYSDMQLGPSSTPSNSNQAASNAAPNTAGATVKLPSFMDEATGRIKDLPEYPGAIRTNMQYGPQNELDTSVIVSRTSDSLEKIAAYYDKAIKDHGWTVSSRTSDASLYKIELKKGDSNRAVVQADKAEEAGTITIGLTRVQLSPQGDKQ